MKKYKSEIVDVIENYLLSNDVINVKRSEIKKWVEDNYDDSGHLKKKPKEEKIFQQWFY